MTVNQFIPAPYSLPGKRVYLAGHNGMVGRALGRRLADESCEVITAARAQLDLTCQQAVTDFFQRERPDAVIIAAARVGGIMANSSFPAEFLYENLMIGTNIIAAAHRADVNRLLYLGSSCIYPRLAPQPIPEDALLTGPLEPTNEAYAIAKIAGIKLAQAYRAQYGRDYIAAMPTNLYGPDDNFDPQSSHVLPALLRKVHDAKQADAAAITIWGSMTPMREFLHVDDCANALVLLLTRYSEAAHINVGSGAEISIHDLTRLICRVVGYEGEIKRDLSKPDGMPRKLMDSARLRALGWAPRIDLASGIAATYRWFVDQAPHAP
jgi:GDP-L-fucose synthase